MKKLLLLPLLLLTACGGGEVASDAVTDEPQWPSYCIREVIFLGDENDPNGRLLLDMPGYPYGQTDMMQEIDRHTYNGLDNIDACKSDDPRMGQKPRGIAWTDGRNTDLDGNPL
jgi:hypothetical protein